MSFLVAHHAISKAIHPYDTLLSFWTRNGYVLPSAAQQTSGRNKINALRNSKRWQKLQSLYVLDLGGDINVKLTNWIDPTLYKGTPVGTLTIDDLYIAGNGTNSYVSFPGGITSGKFQQNDCSLIIRLNNNRQMSAPICGKQTTGSNGRIALIPRETFDRGVAWINVAGSSTATYGGVVSSSVGLFMGSRILASGSGAERLHRNGVLIIAGNSTSQAINANAMLMGAFSDSGNPAQFNNDQFRLYATGQSFNGEESGIYNDLITV